MNRRSKTILISGIITIFATVIISLLSIDDWSGLIGWAFTAMLWSEAVFFGGLILVECISEKTEPIITRSVLYTVISVYAGIDFFVSIFYMTLFEEANTSFAVVQVSLLAIVAIAIVILLATSKGVHRANEKTMKAVVNTESMIEKLNKLAMTPGYEQFASTLKKLSDDLRFTDISKSVPEDAEIREIISSIEIESGSNETTYENIKAKLVRLNTLISQRKLSVFAINKGKI